MKDPKTSQHIQRNVKASALLLYLFAANVQLSPDPGNQVMVVGALNFWRQKWLLQGDQRSLWPFRHRRLRRSWVRLVDASFPPQISSRQFNVFYCSVEKSETNKCLIGVRVGMCVVFLLDFLCNTSLPFQHLKTPNDWKALNLPIYPRSPTFQVKSIPKSWKLPWGPWVLNPRRRRSRRWSPPLALKSPRLVHVDGDLGDDSRRGSWSWMKQF